MPLASRETPPSFTKNIAGGRNKNVRQDSSTDSLVAVLGADRNDASFDVDGVDVGTGDKEFLAENIGGTSLIVASLESDNGDFSVEMDVLKDKEYNGDVDNIESSDRLRTETPGIYTNQQAINSRTIPVASDNIIVRLTDNSGNDSNVIDGTINLHTGGPSSILNVDKSGNAVSPRTEDSDHQTGAGVDVNASTENISLTVPGRPDSVRVLVTNADGAFDVTISFDNTSVVHSGDSSNTVDVERAVMSNQTVDISISDTSGAANTVNYDVLLV